MLQVCSLCQNIKTTNDKTKFQKSYFDMNCTVIRLESSKEIKYACKCIVKHAGIFKNTREVHWELLNAQFLAVNSSKYIFLQT